MAGEILCSYRTGYTLWATVWDRVGRVFNVTLQAFEAYDTAGLADYAVPLVEQGTASGMYVGDMPGLKDGLYSSVVRAQAGASPAEDDRMVATGVIPLGDYVPPDNAGGGAR